MMVTLGSKKTFLHRLACRFLGERRGTAAVEMAFIAPILVTLLLGMVEVVDVLLVDRKVTTMTNSVADLVSRVREIDSTGLDDVFAASEAIMQPFSGANATVDVISIVRDVDNNITVHWSDSSGGTPPYAQGAVYPEALPNGVLAVNESLILAKGSYSYGGPITNFFFSAFTLDTQYYAKPRRSRTVLFCDDLSLDDPTCV